jgi:hypothetical protein
MIRTRIKSAAMCARFGYREPLEIEDRGKHRMVRIAGKPVTLSCSASDQHGPDQAARDVRRILRGAGYVETQV